MTAGYVLPLVMMSLVDRHPIATRILLLLAIIGSGYFEAAVLKSRDLACATWFVALAGLTAWVAYSCTTAAILAGSVVFAAGVGLLIAYYRSSRTDSRKPTR